MNNRCKRRARCESRWTTTTTSSSPRREYKARTALASATPSCQEAASRHRAHAAERHADAHLGCRAHVIEERRCRVGGCIDLRRRALIERIADVEIKRATARRRLCNVDVAGL